MSTSSLTRLAMASLTAFVVLAPSASATGVLSATAQSGDSKLRICHARILAQSATAKVWRTTAADTGLVRAKLRGGGDWDVAVFGAGGRFVAAAAGPTSDDLAQGFVTKGEELTVQACASRGGRSAVSLRVDTFALPLGGSARKVQILSVRVPTHEDRNRLMALGFDDSHSGTKDTLDIVVSEPEEYAKLEEAGFTWTVKYDDLVAMERDRVRADAEFARTTKRTGVPSGRTEYRQLADYEAEMKMLAEKNPGLVKLITMPLKSLEGRTIVGVEIAQNVNVPDGKPVMFQMGIHHAREWPAAEHPMEWAYELVNGYGKSDRVTGLVNRTRTIVVPVVNPDGFNLSRTAPVDPGNAAAAVDIPPAVDDQLPLSDPAYIGVLIADDAIGTFAYKRRNCRIKDGEVPKEGECANSDNRSLGVDPNRNYGGFWGGPGASVDPESDTYRGAGPFSEPEVQNVRETISTHQVVTMITNHTFSNLVLRPPGIKNEGTTPDDAAYKALGDAMAAQNGYTSQHGYELYDTTGTTEDWSYYATGGFGFTFEIGPDEFHPPFAEVVSEYEGAGEYAGKGNREAYFLAQEHTANAKHHSVLKGKAPAGTVLRLHKEFMSTTSPVIKDASGQTDRPQPFKDVLDTTMQVGPSGEFEWHVNPSTRPFAQKDRVYAGVAEKPAFEQDISSPVPVPPGVPEEIEFEVKPEASRQVRASMTSAGPDYDMYLYYEKVDDNTQVASSAGPTGDETISYGFPAPGKYILVIENYSAVAPYDGKLEVFGEQPGTQEVTKAAREAWTLTCETSSGTVLGTRKVEVDRGAVKNLGDACREAAGTDAALVLGVAVKRAKKLRTGTTLRRGLAATVTCSRECTFTASLRLARKTAKKLKVSTILARTKKSRTFTGKRGLRLKFGGKVKRRLRRARTVNARLVVVATDRLGNVRSKTVGVKLRR